MASLNASSVVNGQHWRNDLMKNSDQITNQEILKDPNASSPHNNQMLAQVCCSQTNCDKVKIETMPEGFFQREPGQAPPFGASCNDGRDAPLLKKEAQANAPDPYMPPFCPCVINRGHLVTYCCVRRDCDDASKIDGVRERPRAYSHFKY